MNYSVVHPQDALHQNYYIQGPKCKVKGNKENYENGGEYWSYLFTKKVLLCQ